MEKHRDHIRQIFMRFCAVWRECAILANHEQHIFSVYVAITKAAARQMATIIVPTAQRLQIIKLGTHTSYDSFFRFVAITAEITVKAIAHKTNIIIFRLASLGIDPIFSSFPECPFVTVYKR